MRMRRALGTIAAAGALALAGCTPAAQDALARDAARSTVTRVVVERFPGVPVEPAVNCIIDGADSRQILSLAADTLTGPTAASLEIVTNIVQRPAVLACLAAEGLPALLN